MYDLKVLWEGKSQKCHFFVDDFWGIVVALWAAGIQKFMFAEWKGEIQDYLINLFLIIIIFYEVAGKFIIRYYYVRNVCYKLYNNKLVIEIKVFRNNYRREFYIKDISSLTMKKYERGLGSIHFGDAETKYWDRWNGKYDGTKDNVVVTTVGLWRKDNKWKSGILYNIPEVEKVYYLLENLINEYL